MIVFVVATIIVDSIDAPFSSPTGMQTTSFAHATTRCNSRADSIPRFSAFPHDTLPSLFTVIIFQWNHIYLPYIPSQVSAFNCHECLPDISLIVHHIFNTVTFYSFSRILTAFLQIRVPGEESVRSAPQ